jgi:endothelin-converting enzyme/putative endopeptidase
VAPGGYFANVLAAREFESDRQVQKIGRPVDETEWRMTPQMVNAYYNPLVNEIAFPAGILQPPFFRRDHPAAMNYGAIGAVMGHELTHGFDDQGRKFDPQGRLQEWWAPEVARRFEDRARCVERQYSGYEVEPGVAVQGELTLGENIADNGGLKQAYDAYKGWEAQQGEEVPPAVPGLTNDQLFFVSYAQVWCAKMTPEAARMQVTVDPHSPARFRVIGAITNHPAFGAAFQCAPGTPMNPVDKCQVW